MPIVQVKILKGISSVLVGKRELCKTYVTSTDIKPNDTFHCLKAMTTAGQIQNYPKQMEAIKVFCKTSKSTFYNRLHWLEKRGLAWTIKGTLYLASWEKYAQYYELETIEFHLINYDTENKGQTIEYILKTVEIAENQQRQNKEIQRKINKTPEIELAFNSRCRVQGKTAEFTLNNLHHVQRETYSQGAADYDVLHSVNPDVNRSAKSIKKAYGFVSNRNVAYLKRQLEKRGLAKVTKRVSPVCKYPEHVKAERGKTVGIGVIAALLIPCVTSGKNISEIKRGCKPKAYTGFYDRKTNSRIWRLPDNIEPNTQIIPTK